MGCQTKSHICLSEMAEDGGVSVWDQTGGQTAIQVPRARRSHSVTQVNGHYWRPTTVYTGSSLCYVYLWLFLPFPRARLIVPLAGKKEEGGFWGRLIKPELRRDASVDLYTRDPIPALVAGTLRSTCFLTQLVTGASNDDIILVCRMLRSELLILTNGGLFFGSETKSTWYYS